jgi:hypothetical protein
LCCPAHLAGKLPSARPRPVTPQIRAGSLAVAGTGRHRAVAGAAALIAIQALGSRPGRQLPA